MAQTVYFEDKYEMTMEMEEMYQQEIASASDKKLFIEVEWDKKDKMLQQFQIQNYKQITPNSNDFFKKMKYHDCIVDKC